MRNYRAFSKSVRGISHIIHEKVCQDYSACRNTSSYVAAAAADGHGCDECFRSDRGAKFAVESALSCMTDKIFLNKFSENVDSPKVCDRLILQLEKSIIYSWNMKVKADVLSEPFSDEELSVLGERERDFFRSGREPERAYGSTIIAAIVTEKYWLAVQLGDGKCVILGNDDRFAQPVPENDLCFLNVTTSLCDFDAVWQFRHTFSTDIPKCIFTATDGVDKSFVSPEKMYTFYRLVYNAFKNDNFLSAKTELFKYLEVLSFKGSRDDISVSAIVAL